MVSDLASPEIESTTSSANKKKHYHPRSITPKQVTRGEIHLRGVAPG